MELLPSFKSPSADQSTPKSSSAWDYTTPLSVNSIWTVWMNMNPIRRKQSVCRNLFGPVDHEQLRRDLRQKMKEMTERDSRRWNFNFHSDTPLPGSFEWEQIPADGGFALYRESTQMKEEEEEDRLQDCEEENQGGNQENCSSISNTPKGPAEATPVRRKRVHIKCARRSRDQDARIPDFFVKRRRTSETKSILSPFVQTSMEAALRKTIR